MLHNTAVKNYASIPAFIVSGAIHAAVLIPVVPAVTIAYANRGGGQPTEPLRNAILSFVIGWCIVAAVWSALAAHVLGNPTNKWGGLRGFQLIGAVAGLTLALNLVNSMCLFFCPATGLALPILTYVALYNNSMPPTEEDKAGPPPPG
jgi:hypothetical protein